LAIALLLVRRKWDLSHFRRIAGASDRAGAAVERRSLSQVSSSASALVGCLLFHGGLRVARLKGGTRCRGWIGNTCVLGELLYARVGHVAMVGCRCNLGPKLNFAVRLCRDVGGQQA
jgi:hypothetical protein